MIGHTIRRSIMTWYVRMPGIVNSDSDTKYKPRMFLPSSRCCSSPSVVKHAPPSARVCSQRCMTCGFHRILKGITCAFLDSWVRAPWRVTTCICITRRVDPGVCRFRLPTIGCAFPVFLIPRNPLLSLGIASNAPIKPATSSMFPLSPSSEPADYSVVT